MMEKKNKIKLWIAMVLTFAFMYFDFFIGIYGVKISLGPLITGLFFVSVITSMNKVSQNK